MIELLGVGVPRRGRGWLLRHICATLEAGELTTVLSADVEERRALLDTMTGRRLPDEGRVWLDRVPIMADSLARVRRLCGEVDAAADGLMPRRSALWNALAPTSGPSGLGRLLRLPRRRERDAVRGALERVGLRAHIDDPVAVLSTFDRVRLLVARALARGPHSLVVRDPDAVLSAGETGALLALLRLLARADRLGVVVSLTDSAAGQGFADRVLLLHEGRLLFSGPPNALTAPPAGWQAAALTR